jgi:hypothetical protein
MIDLETIGALAGSLALALIIRATFSFHRWSRRRFAEQLDADYRAFVMVEEAKREAARRA